MKTFNMSLHSDSQKAHAFREPVSSALGSTRMKPNYPMIVFELCFCVVLCSCESKTTVPVPEPPTPTLSGFVLEEGDPVLLCLEMPGEVPGGAWKLETDTKKTWIWYVRIDGKDYRLNTGLHPFNGLSSNLNLRDDLDSPPSWIPGDYKVSYVLKDIDVVHQEDASVKRHYDELVGNTLTIKIIPKDE